MTHRAWIMLAWLGIAGLSPAPRVLADGTLSLAPSYLQAQQRVAERTAAALEQTLLSMPEVIAARVHIGQADPSRAQLDEPLPPPRVSAWLKLSGPGPGDDSIRAVLAAAVPGLAPDSIYIARSLAPPTPPEPMRLTHVGPFRVAVGSAPWLRGLLGILFASNMALCTWILRRGRHTFR